MSHVLFVGGPRDGQSAEVWVDPTPPTIMVPLFDWDKIFRGYTDPTAPNPSGDTVTETGTYTLNMWGNVPIYVYQDMEPGMRDVAFHGALNKWALTELMKRNR